MEEYAENGGNGKHKKLVFLLGSYTIGGDWKSSWLILSDWRSRRISE